VDVAVPGRPSVIDTSRAAHVGLPSEAGYDVIEAGTTVDGTPSAVYPPLLQSAVRY
jgi:hypothetical protein